jgi:phage shock protein A
VYEPKKVKKSLAQQLAEADNRIDALDDQVKHLRAALMALEAEVSPAMREFIREVLA